MFRWILCPLLGMFFWNLGFGQESSATIQGIVRDSTSGEILTGASVTLRSSTSKIIRNVISDEKGFRIDFLVAGEYTLVASFLGYSEDTTCIIISGGNFSSKFYTFRLKRGEFVLKPVTVNGVIPATSLKGDTLIFNPNAVALQSSATLEDLLRRLPGVELDKDGNITIGGKKVEKIFIDGKEILIDDIRLATTNIPIDIISKIETFNAQTDKGALTGIQDNTRGSAINIQLKDNQRLSKTGKVYVGNGSSTTYTFGGNILDLDLNETLLASAKLNNIGDLFNGRENVGSQGILGIDKVTGANINYNYSFTKGGQISFNGILTNSVKSNLHTTENVIFLGDSSLLGDIRNAFNRKSSIKSLHFRGELPLDSFKRIVYQMHVASQDMNEKSDDTTLMTVRRNGANFQSDYKSSAGLTSYSQGTRMELVNQNIDFISQSRKRGRLFYLGLENSCGVQIQPAFLSSVVVSFDSLGKLLQTESLSQQLKQNSSNSAYGGYMGFAESISPTKSLDFSYKIKLEYDRSDKEGLDYDSVTTRYSIPDTGVSNQLRNNSNEQLLHASLNLNSKHMKYQVGIVTQYSMLSYFNYSRNFNLTHRFVKCFPKFNFEFILPKEQNLQISYSEINIIPTIDQLQPVPDLSNPYLIRVGNTNLTPAFQNNLDATFNGISSQNKTNLQIAFHYDLIKNAISNSIILLQGGVQESKYINIDGNFDLASSITYGFPLPSQKSSGSIQVHYTVSHQVGTLNDMRVISALTAVGCLLKLNYHPLERFFLYGNMQFNVNSNVYALNISQNARLIAQSYNLDASIELPGSINCLTFYSLTHTSSQAGLPSQQSSYWNIAVYKSLFKDKRGQIHFSIFDILNTSNGLTQSSGLNYISTDRTNTLGRFWLLSFVWNFSKFRK